MSILVLSYLSSAVFRRGGEKRGSQRKYNQNHILLWSLQWKKRRNSCSEQNKHINTNVPQCAITQARRDSCPLLITLAWRLSSLLLFFYSDNFSNFYCLYFWSCCIPVLPYATTKLFKHRFFPPTRAWSGLVRRSYGCSLGQRERFT